MRSRTVASVLSAEQKALPAIAHRIARPHPVTGRKALYAVSGSSFGIVGMPQGEACALLVRSAVSQTRGSRRRQGGLNLFALNRDLKNELTVEVSARGFPRLKVGNAKQLQHSDLSACNTKHAPDKVSPSVLPGVSVQGERLYMTFASASWNIVRFEPA